MSKNRDGRHELNGYLREYGYTKTDGINILVSRRERVDLYDAMSKAKSQTGEEIPVVMWRRDNSKWLVTMELEDFMAMYRSWEMDTRETRDMPFHERMKDDG